MKKTLHAIKRYQRPLALLGGITASQFLAEYWQKKPLLIRAAIPQFAGVISAEDLAGLACEEDVQARMVKKIKDVWQLEQGPFDEKYFSRLPAKNWTLLVQGVNHHSQAASDLLQQFDFIPHARLDDLMVSYAPDGGGVGPHFDSYDVFLLQGQGKRRWRLSDQQDLGLVENAPLRILKYFDTTQEWLLESGDMLYLPPHIAHWGLAEGECMTYSIGFRAPSAQELGSEFLSYLQDKFVLSGMYQDPDLHPQRHPAKISSAMLAQVTDMLSNIRWTQADVAKFLGQYLSEPKPHVVFDPPRNISIATFKNRLEKKGIRLDLKTQMLFHGQHYFINGELVKLPKSSATTMRELADQRYLAPESCTDNIVLERLYEWYMAGYLQF